MARDRAFLYSDVAASDDEGGGMPEAAEESRIESGNPLNQGIEVAQRSSSWRLFSRLYKDYLGYHLLPLLVALLCMIAVAVASSTQTYLMGPLIDKALLAGDRTRLWFIAAAILTVFMVRSAARFGQEVLLVMVGQKIVATIQSHLIDRIVHCNLDTMSRNSSGALAALFTYDANTARLAVCDVFLVAGKDTLTIITMIGLMFYTNWRLALMCLVLPVLAIIPMRLLGKQMRTISRVTQVKVGELTRSLAEVFQGIKTVKSFGLETRETHRIGRQMSDLARLVVKGAWVGGAILPVVDGIAGLAVASVILVGGVQVISHAVTPGQLFVFVSAIVGAYASVPSLSKVNVTLQTGLAAAERIFTFLDRRSSVPALRGAAILPATSGSIQFENVGFAYENGAKVFDRLNFVADGGSVTAIVGRSGAGKSTILNLIARLYDPIEGEVSITGHDIRAVDIHSLRRNVAIVAQETIVFDDTILNNIRYGRQNANDDEVKAIAELVGIAAFCAPLRDGLRTQVGERGLRLSGGQRQLIGIARALLKDAPILLLDEPTSFQDAQSEEVVQKALRQLMAGRTTLVAAHRLGTVRDAAAIHVLEEGCIVESGTHEDLIRRRGVYARLNAFQAAPGFDNPHVSRHDAPSEEGV